MDKIEITIPEIRSRITQELNSRYGSVKVFSENKKLRYKAGLRDFAPATIQSVLAGSGSTSFTIFNKLWEFLQFGELTKTTVKITTYYESENDKSGQ